MPKKYYKIYMVWLKIYLAKNKKTVKFFFYKNLKQNCSILTKNMSYKLFFITLKQNVTL